MEYTIEIINRVNGWVNIRITLANKRLKKRVFRLSYCPSEDRWARTLDYHTMQNRMIINFEELKDAIAQ